MNDLHSLSKQGINADARKGKSAEVPCLREMKIVHNTVLKTNEL